MPRLSTSSKRQQGASNQRDTRHENGVVGPGKRLVKQKSYGQLDVANSSAPSTVAENGSTDANTQNNVALAPAPNTSLASLSPNPPAAVVNASARYQDEMSLDNRVAGVPRRSSLGAYSESSSSDSMATPPIPTIPEEGHRRIDVNAAKNSNVHRDTGPLEFALTVLRSCPLQDTIAILIILMQLSPIALSSIYMLFTLLTFVPPVTTSSGLSITDIFEGNMGTPSLTTLACMDIVVLLVWLFLWAPLQQLILDLAQVVIALTLGGGASSRQKTTNNIFLCVGIVIFSHFGRFSILKKFPQLHTILGPGRFLTHDPDDPLESSFGTYERKGPYAWIKSILAIHILMQGLVRYIRDWYLRREKRDLLSQSQADPEAGKSGSFAGDASTDGGFSTPDIDLSQSNATNVSAKKRRKQSAQVRVRQPLWAALASTKIVMVKEYELSHAATESAGSNATDIHNLGNAPFNTQPEQIWVCYVGCDEVCFSTSHFPDYPDMDSISSNGTAAGSSWIDTSKPFYVRVNNAIWQPTRIHPLVDDGESDQEGTKWTGDIYGLTPLSTYECEFVSTRTGEVIFSTSVRTIQALSKDYDTVAKAPSGPQSHNRKDSPATTLKTSITSQEVKLMDEKAKLKALRKENNRRANAIKKEIEKLTFTVQSAGGNDEKLRQKIHQNNIQQKQAEQFISDLEAQIRELESIPEDVMGKYRQKQGAWKSEKSQFDIVRSSYKSFKISIEHQLKTLEEEQNSLQAKRTKIATRIAKVDNEHARITDANARGLDEVERRRQERAALEADIARAEQDYRDRISGAQARNGDKAHHAGVMAATLQTYLNSFNTEVALDAVDRQQPNGFQPAPWASMPPAPGPFLQGVWGNGTTTAPGSSVLSAVAPAFPGTLQHLPPAPKARGRSSSMLSDVSGFTQSSTAADDEVFNPFGGSGSGAGASGSGSGSGASGGGSARESRCSHAIPIVPPISTKMAPDPGPGFRGPAASAFARARGGSGSGFGSASGSGSSVRSGSGSAGGSVRDPTSPI